MYCGHCGKPLDAAEHRSCELQLLMEPPRFCTTCARRMKVQVHPLGWTAECSEHGVIEDD